MFVGQVGRIVKVGGQEVRRGEDQKHADYMDVYWGKLHSKRPERKETVCIERGEQRKRMNIGKKRQNTCARSWSVAAVRPVDSKGRDEDIDDHYHKNQARG